MIIHTDIDYDYLQTNSAVSDDINYQPHFHSTYEMLYTLNIGEAYYNISASKFRIGVNDLIIIQPGMLHNLQIIPGQEYERIVMYFSKENIHSDLHDFLQTISKIYHIQDDSPIKIAFSLLQKNSKLFSKEEFTRTLEGVLNIILTHLKYSHEEKKTEILNAQNNTINKILNYIEENITQPLNADNISKKFFVSKSWLSHNFKKYLNISLKNISIKKNYCKSNGLFLQVSPSPKRWKIVLLPIMQRFFANINSMPIKNQAPIKKQIKSTTSFNKHSVNPFSYHKSQKVSVSKIFSLFLWGSNSYPTPPFSKKL